MRRPPAAVVLPPLLLVLVGCADGESISKDRVPNRVEPDKVGRVETSKLGMMVREPEPQMHKSECELGETKPCWDRSKGEVGISADGSDQWRFRKVCVAGPSGVRRFSLAACNTPLVVSFEENEPVEFTTPSTGTRDFGKLSSTEWVAAKTPWLGRDLDGNGCIDDQDELFGPGATGETGFDSLSALDSNGDSVIDGRDVAFEFLLLWSDENQDKNCTPNEVTRLKDAGIESLSLRYTRKPSDPLRSYEGESSTLRQLNGKRGRVIDVYLAPLR